MEFVNPRNNMSVSIGGLKSLCEKNVVELLFKKRTNGLHRRMLATLDYSLLNSPEGMQIFNFKPPRYFPPFDASSKGLVTLFDIFMLNWRNVPASSVEIIMAIPTQPPDAFWDYFDKFISKMSATQKASFMQK